MIEYKKYRTNPPEDVSTYAFQFIVPEGMSVERAFVDVTTAVEGQARIVDINGLAQPQILFSAANNTWQSVDPGDYIVSVGGRYYAVRKIIFEAIYIPEGETAPPAPITKPKRVRRTQAQIAADKAAGK